MYKQMKKCNKNNGITLIALVLTIIVLLILAGVALSLALGQNGLVFKSRESKQEQEIAQEKDRIMTAYAASFTNKDGKFNKDTFKEELRKQGIVLDGEIEENGKTLKFKTKDVEYVIENGILQRKQIGQNQSETPTIPTDLKVGDTIIYDPTKGVSDNSKLTYTSQKGTAQTGGNGYGTQTITAKSNNNEWIVISTANNQVKVIAKEPIEDVIGGEGSKFTLKGGIGWLYAEEELHKACSIYGHGKGAVQTTTTYKIGNYNVPGEAQTKTLSNSAARSMTMEDVVKIMKGEEYLDFTEEEKKFFEPGYMDSGRKSKEIFYPTITSTEENGNSTTKERYENEWYYIAKENNKYDKELVTDPKVKENKEKLKNHIYKNNRYWLASRLVVSYYRLSEFRIRDVSSTYIAGYPIYIYVSNLTVNAKEEFIRPVVYLKGGMLEEQAQGVWKIKE